MQATYKYLALASPSVGLHAEYGALLHALGGAIVI